MFIIAYLSWIVCFVALALFSFAKNEQTKTRRVGEIMFGFGLLVSLAAGVHHP
jgi:Na+/phosphate symporter